MVYSFLLSLHGIGRIRIQHPKHLHSLFPGRVQIIAFCGGARFLEPAPGPFPRLSQHVVICRKTFEFVLL
jgi:hypothetical protein